MEPILSAIAKPPKELDSLDDWWGELEAVTAFPFRATIKERSLGLHDQMRIVNFARSTIAPAIGTDALGALLGQLDESSELWSDDKWLVPAIQGDGVIQRLCDQEAFSDDDDEAAGEARDQPASETIEVPLEALRAMQRTIQEQRKLIETLSKDPDIVPKAPSTTKPHIGGVSDKAYFGSYAESGIHAEMLQDVPRTATYKRAIEQAVQHLGPACVVVDVGAGTGILSLFAAAKGARVLAIEGSDLAAETHEAVTRNGMAPPADEAAPGFVKVSRKRAEAVTDSDLPASASPQCDAVVSEWMGYALFFEDMLPSVLAVRDKFLRPGGMLLPDRATMTLAAIGDRSSWRRAAGFWNRTWGFDFSHMNKFVPTAVSVQRVLPSSICTTPAVFADIDLLACNATTDLEPCSDFVMLDLARPEKDVAAMDTPVAAAGECPGEALEFMSSSHIHGFAVWFATAFEGRGRGGSAAPASFIPECLDTSPTSTTTHWQQAVFWLKDPVPKPLVMHPESGELRGRVELRRALGAPRCYDMRLRIAKVDGGVLEWVWRVE
jgi:type I protein arginine methyltransferase